MSQQDILFYKPIYFLLEQVSGFTSFCVTIYICTKKTWVMTKDVKINCSVNYSFFDAQKIWGHTVNHVIPHVLKIAFFWPKSPPRLLYSQSTERNLSQNYSIDKNSWRTGRSANLMIHKKENMYQFGDDIMTYF